MRQSTLPDWFKREIPSTEIIEEMKGLSLAGVGTVCKEARCPNFSECLAERRLTFIILGPVCTRSCRFCAVKKSGTVLEASPNAGEPARVARTVKEYGITHAVVTSVTRDDLPDGGAAQFAAVVSAIRQSSPEATIELLVPDFNGSRPSLKTVIDSRPDVLAHNMETVPRLYPELRPGADYKRSLALLRDVKSMPGGCTKSSFMLGLGETEEELLSSMRDLCVVGCDILTLGQYLSPSPSHAPVKEFVTPEKFERLRQSGLKMGFKAVLSGPLVRSSYKAAEVYKGIL